MDIKISRSEGYYTAVIRELHIVDQAKTLPELKESLEEAIELTVRDIIENGSYSEIKELQRIFEKDLKKQDRSDITEVITGAIVKRTIGKGLVVRA